MMRGASVGHHLFGAAAVAFGLIAMMWHEYSDWNLLHVWGGAAGPALVYVVAAAAIFGGIAIQFPRLARGGAVALVVVFLFFTLLRIPPIVAAPRTYDGWGNFFEQFSLVLGGALVYASMSPKFRPKMVTQIGGILLGVCAVSFTIEQAIHLNVTAGLVPKWLPPSQSFWAIATTVAFALAAVALLINRVTLLATRLLTAMIALFGIIVWVPLLIAAPHDHGSWGETIETFAISGTAWILADLLGRYSGTQAQRTA